MGRAHPGWERPYREVLTPTGRRIKCRDEAEFRRVTLWVAWLRARQARRNGADLQRLLDADVERIVRRTA